jgi:hypothetical protein
VGNYEVKQSFVRFLPQAAGQMTQEGVSLRLLTQTPATIGDFWQSTFVKGFGTPIYKCESLTYTWKGCRWPAAKRKVLSHFVSGAPFVYQRQISSLGFSQTEGLYK